MAPDLTSIQNFLQLSPTLATAGQPRREQFALVAGAGYEAVINLAIPTSLDGVPDEAELFAELGLGYYHIPVEWENPSTEDLLQFFDLMDLLEGQKVFVHCARNMRVSAFIFLYRVLRQGRPAAACTPDLEKIWQPNGVWEDFIQKNVNRDKGAV